MNRLSISAAWDETRAIFARDGGLLVTLSLALVVLPDVIVSAIRPDAGMNSNGSALGLFAFLPVLIAFLGQLALIRLAVGPSITVQAAIMHAARRFLPALGAFLLLGLGLMIIAVPVLMVLSLVGAVTIPSAATAAATPGFALALLVMALLGLAVSVKFMLVPAVASSEEGGPLHIIKRSWTLSNGHYWRLFAVIMLLLVVALVMVVAAGAIGGTIGRLISPQLEPLSLGALILAVAAGLAQGAYAILVSTMIARIYVQLAGRDTAAAELHPSVPSSGS